MAIRAIIIKNNSFDKAKAHTIIITDTIIVIKQRKKEFPTCKALVTLTKKSVWSNIDAVTIETHRWLTLSNYFCTIFTCVKGIIGTLDFSKYLGSLVNFLQMSNL